MKIVHDRDEENSENKDDDDEKEEIKPIIKKAKKIRTPCSFGIFFF